MLMHLILAILVLLAAAEAILLFRVRQRKPRNHKTEIIRTGIKVTSGELIPAALHELAQPLSVIRGYTELLQMQDTMLPPEKAAEYLTMMLQSADKMQQILNEMRKLTNVKLNRTLAPLDPAETVRQLVQLFNVQFANRRINLRLELQDGIPPILIDRDQLRFILLNLLNNARDALESREKERRIEIFMHEEKKKLYCKVIDNGTGMSPDVLIRCRELFFTTKPDGTGVGLPCAENLINGMNGTLSIISTPDYGTEIEFIIPYPIQSHITGGGH